MAGICKVTFCHYKNTIFSKLHLNTNMFNKANCSKVINVLNEWVEGEYFVSPKSINSNESSIDTKAVVVWSDGQISMLF